MGRALGTVGSDPRRARHREERGILETMPSRALLATLWSVILFFTPAGLSYCFLFLKPNERSS